jgi:hypothetical protein
VFQVLIISLEILNSAAYNADALSRGKRTFPAATSSKCTYEKEALKDLVEMLKTVNKMNVFSTRESARILETLSSKYGSVSECDLLIKSILANCKDIIDLRNNGNTNELEEKLQQLQRNLDNVERSASETEATLRQSFENAREALKLELNQSELKRQEIEKNHEQAVMKLVIIHLQNSDVKSALTEFMALKNRDAWTEKLVESAFSDSKVQLPLLAKFVCKINDFTTGYIGINALHKEMDKNNQLEEIETILLYYRTKIFMEDIGFEFLSFELKNNYHELISKLLPHQNSILTSLVREIKSEALDRSKKAVEGVGCIGSKSEEYLLTDVMTLYLRGSSTRLAQFPQLYKFVVAMNSYSSTCYAFAAIWKELKAHDGAGETMEALAVWSYASDITKMQHISDAQCIEIADSRAPAYKETLFSKYENYINNGGKSQIRELHKTYELSYVFDEYVRSLSLIELQNDNYFNKLVDVIDNLPFYYDICSAAATVYERFEASSMLGTYEHFQTLQIAYSWKDSSYGPNKCKEVLDENMPTVFKKLLDGETSNCRLINRYYNEPLYCPTRWYERNSGGITQISTWILNDDDPGQYWNIKAFRGNGVVLTNNYYTKFHLRFLEGSVYGADKDYNLNYDYFRIHSKDDYILLEPTLSKFVLIL